MKYETTTTYTKTMITKAAARYWVRKYLRDAVLSVILLGVVSYFFFFESYNNWAVGFFLAVSLIYAVAAYAIFFVWRARSLAMFYSLGTPEARWSFSNDNIVCESGAGKAELNWSTIKNLWRFPDVWLMFYASGAYSTLPVESLSEDARNFIQQKVREAGGHVT